MRLARADNDDMRRQVEGWLCHVRRAGTFLLTLLLVTPHAWGSQPAEGVPRVRLPPATARSSHEFVVVSAIREFANGSVLVVDRYSTDQPIVLVDFEADAAHAIGRRGDGPGEYRSALSLVPLGGDSSLVSDGVLDRWLILVRGEIVETRGPATLSLQAVGTLLAGGDRRGHVVGLRGFRVGNPARLTHSTADSLLVIRGHVVGNVIDTLARLRGAGARMQRVRLVGVEGAMARFLPNPLLVHDQAVLFPDGWIAVAATSPYRVDWRHPDGRWTRGRPLPFTPGSVAEEERRAAMTRAFGNVNSGATPTSALADWPSVLPPFLDDPLIPLPNGNLAIRRLSSARDPTTRHDIIDREGALVAILELAAGHRLVGVGSRGAYVAVTDEDGITRLSRHPLARLER